MTRLYSMLLIFSIICNASCKPGIKSINEFGVGYNKKRAELGLPLLDSAWRLVQNDGNILKWMPLVRRDSSIFLSKLVTVDNGKLKREENKFLGRKKYETVDGTFFEHLYVSCLFDENANVLNWDCLYRGPDFIFGRSLDKKEADSILKSWGLRNN